MVLFLVFIIRKSLDYTNGPKVDFRMPNDWQGSKVYQDV